MGFMSVGYDFKDGDETKWIEFGSTMALQDPEKEPYQLIKGVNLYPSIIACQTIQEFLTTGITDKFIANIYDDNQAVLHMLTNRVGWEVFEPEDDILKACKATKGDTNQHGAERVWLNAPTNTLPPKI